MVIRHGPLRRLLPLWLLLALFALPPIAAWLFYLNPALLPEARSNHGELLQPAIPLPSGELRVAGGGAFDNALLAGRWTLLTLTRRACEENCRERLTDLRQIRLALGEGSRSVERLLILDSAAAESVPGLHRSYPGMHIVIADPPTLERFMTGPDGRTAAESPVYLLDPMGRLMMRYARGEPAGGILEDMQRLLKASKNWIKGAQYGHR